MCLFLKAGFNSKGDEILISSAGIWSGKTCLCYTQPGYKGRTYEDLIYPNHLLYYLPSFTKLLPITFPGQLNSDIQVPESNKKIFHDLLTDLKKGLKKNAEKQHLVLPLECHYLNKNAFLSVVGSQPQNVKHFTLRRKPKAAALKAEMMNKSQVSPS